MTAIGLGDVGAFPFVEAPDGTSTSTAVDELGCFIVALPAPGPVRLRLEGAGARVVTDWVVIR